jgi:hypothetical protein
MEDDQDSFTLKVWLAIWRTGVQLFYILVVFGILRAVHTPQAKLTTALAGILYATVRSGFVGFSLYFQGVLPPVYVQLDKIQVAVTGGEPEINRIELERSIRKGRVPQYFEMVGLSIIYFMCLAQIFGLTSDGTI